MSPACFRVARSISGRRIRDKINKKRVGKADWALTGLDSEKHLSPQFTVILRRKITQCLRSEIHLSSDRTHLRSGIFSCIPLSNVSFDLIFDSSYYPMKSNEISEIGLE